VPDDDVPPPGGRCAGAALGLAPHRSRLRGTADGFRESFVASAGGGNLAVPIAFVAPSFRPTGLIHGRPPDFVAHIVLRETFVSGLDPQNRVAEVLPLATIPELTLDESRLPCQRIYGPPFSSARL